MKAIILYRQFLKNDEKTLFVGGIETYMLTLSKLIIKLGHKPIICQFSDHKFQANILGIDVFGFNTKKMTELYKQTKSLYSEVDDLLIYATDSLCLNTGNKKTLTIQHGIWWDIPYKTITFTNILRKVRNLFVGYVNPRKIKNVVCVDYNFYNWYKTISLKEPKNFHVIPNFAKKTYNVNEFRQDHLKSNNSVSLVFARRFYDYRGSLIFLSAIKRILNITDKISVVIAGEGPYLNNFVKELSSDTRVSFTKYNPEDSFEFHKQFDIVVVPSLASEGTSLSLIEAMGAGCLAVTTPVGGCSNIVIDGHNGYICMPNEESLYNTILKAIQQVESGNLYIRENAIRTVNDSFCLKVWEDHWTEIIKSFE